MLVKLEKESKALTKQNKNLRSMTKKLRGDNLMWKTRW